MAEMAGAGWMVSRGHLIEDGAGQGAFNLCLAVDPLNAAVVYAGNSGLWKSSDYGTNWQDLMAAATCTKTPTRSSSISPPPGSFYLIGDSGVWRSTNNGASFHRPQRDALRHASSRPLGCIPPTRISLSAGHRTMGRSSMGAVRCGTRDDPEIPARPSSMPPIRKPFTPSRGFNRCGAPMMAARPSI